MAILKQHYPKVSLHAAVMLYTQQSVLIQLGMFIRVVTVMKASMNDKSHPCSKVLLSNVGD